MKGKNLNAAIVLGGLLSLLLVFGACSSGDDEEATSGQAVQTTTQTTASASQTGEQQAPAASSAPSAPSAVAAAMFAAEPESGMPQYGGILRLSSADDPRSLNFLDNVSATTGSTMQAVYDRLNTWKWEGGTPLWKEIGPGLAESWEVSENGLTWTFKLRDDVVFHDGSPFTSADVKATYDHYVNSAKTGEYRPPARSYTAPFIESVSTPDDYTAVLHLLAPANVLLMNLNTGWTDIVNKEDIDKHGIEWFTTNANGTGPFRWVPEKWERGVSFELERNDNYWQEGLPFLDGKKYTVIGSAALIQAAFETQQIDHVTSGNIGDVQEVVKKLGDKVRLVEGPGGSPAYALLNVRVPPFDDVRVRQAVYLWLDRYAIKDKTLQGAPGFVGTWFETNTFPGDYGTPLEDLQKKDPAYAPLGTDAKTAARQRAMEILREAGYNDLSKFKLQVISRGMTPTGATVLGSQVLASQLGEMGFSVNFQTQEQLAAVEKFKSGEGWNATLYTSALPYPAPESMLGRYIWSKGQRNYSGLVDETVDKYVDLINGAIRETDRRQYISELEDYLSTGQNANFFIYFSGVQFLEQSYVHGRRFVSSWWSQYDERTWLDERSPTR